VAIINVSTRNPQTLQPIDLSIHRSVGSVGSVESNNTITKLKIIQSLLFVVHAGLAYVRIHLRLNKSRN